MLSSLLAGNSESASAQVTRAQLPLLLNQLVVTTSFTAEVAVETDTAFDATVFIGAALIPAEVAVETDTAFDATIDNPPGVISLSVTPAVETDTAFTATVSTSTPAAYPGVTYPSSTTYPWSGDYKAVDVAVETDTAFDVDSPLYAFLLSVSETDSPSLAPASEEGILLTPATQV